MSNNLKVKVYHHNTVSTFPCGLCGAPIEEDMVAAALIDETADGSPTYYANDICQECLDGGRVGAAQRMLAYAARLKAEAEGVEQFAERVRNIAAENWRGWNAVEEMHKTVVAMMELEPQTASSDDLPF